MKIGETKTLKRISTIFLGFVLVITMTACNGKVTDASQTMVNFTVTTTTTEDIIQVNSVEELLELKDILSIEVITTGYEDIDELVYTWRILYKSETVRLLDIFLLQRTIWSKESIILLLFSIAVELQI